MALIPDLVQVSKLETHFYVDPNCTQHVRYTFGNTSRKKIREEEQWRREKDIGCGGGGVVWLERCLQSGKERNVRAVKKIRKVDSSTYYRELEAMALFSHSKVRSLLMLFIRHHLWPIYSCRLSMNRALSNFSAGMRIVTAYLSLWNIF